MAQLKGYTIVLQATENGVPLYAKLGFVDTGVLHQHHGPAPVVPVADLLPGERVHPLTSNDISPAALYSKASSSDRSALIDALLAHDKGVRSADPR